MNSKQAIEGTCLTMCSESETQRRENNHLLHKFEVLDIKNMTRLRADRAKMVKEYTRPAAGKLTVDYREVRPPRVLKTTMDYLQTVLVNEKTCPYSVVYDYVFDRIRAIRQDMVVQNFIQPALCIGIFERSIIFYALSAYKLCEEPISVFDLYLNEQHLQECLKRLLLLYSDSTSANRDLFEAFYLVFNLGDNHALTHCLSLPDKIRSSTSVHIAMRMSLDWTSGNYFSFFKILKKLPPLLVLAAHRNMELVRRLAFQRMSAAYNSTTLLYPVDKLCKLLLFDSEDKCKEACTYYGLLVTDNGTLFQKNSFLTSKPVMKSNRSVFIDSKIEELEPIS